MRQLCSPAGIFQWKKVSFQEFLSLFLRAVTDSSLLTLYCRHLSKDTRPHSQHTWQQRQQLVWSCVDVSTWCDPQHNINFWWEAVFHRTFQCARELRPCCVATSTFHLESSKNWTFCLVCGTAGKACVWHSMRRGLVVSNKPSQQFTRFPL